MFNTTYLFVLTVDLKQAFICICQNIIYIIHELLNRTNAIRVIKYSQKSLRLTCICISFQFFKVIHDVSLRLFTLLLNYSNNSH